MTSSPTLLHKWRREKLSFYILCDKFLKYS
jgi:hypothetical protein